VGAAIGLVDPLKLTSRWTDAFFWGAALVTVLVVTWPRVQVVETAEDAPPAVQRQRVGALFIIFGIVVLFWMAFHQNGSTLTFWAEKNTRTSWNPEIFQVFNAGFVVLFTPRLGFFWGRLRRAGREPSTPAKVGVGMVLTAACYSLMATAGLAGGDTGQVSAMWLIGGYAVVTLGELCLSPVGLSLVAKLAPQALRGSLMGAWFLATSIGNKLAGDVGETYWAKLPHSRFFAILVVLCLMAAGVLLVLLPRLRRAMPKEVDEVAPQAAPTGEPAPARS
jgi:POT family proton-dependent oligopeptide transporter